MSESELERDFDQDEEQEPKKIRKRRPLWISLIMVVVCIYFMFSLGSDLLYFFVRQAPVDIGEPIGFQGSDLPDDTFVSVSGIRNPSKGIGLSTWFYDKNVFQLMGTSILFVETDKADDKKQDSLHKETFEGRLQRFSNVTYYPTVRDFAAFQFGVDIPETAILIKTTEKPGSMIWVPVVYLILSVILLVNIWLVIRRLSGR